MKNYLLFEKELDDLGLRKSKITNKEGIQMYNDMIKNGTPLPQNISATKIKDSNGSDGYIFWQLNTNEEIEALIELENLRANNRTALAATYFMVLSIIGIAIYIILYFMAA